VKITEVATFVVGNPPPSFGGAYFVIAKLVTDDGLVGYGEAYGATFRAQVTAAAIEDLADQCLIGTDPHHVERFWRRLIGPSGPTTSQLLRQRLRGPVARAGEGMDRLPGPDRELGEEVRGRPEAVEAEGAYRASLAGLRPRAIADQPRAEERRRLDIGKGLGDGKAEISAGDDGVGVAPVAGPPGEGRRVAQVFGARKAIAAPAAGLAEPGDAPAVADGDALDARPHRIHTPDDLMAGNERAASLGQVAIDHMKVGAADAAGADPQPQLARGRLGIGASFRAQAGPGMIEHHREHRGASLT